MVDPLTCPACQAPSDGSLCPDCVPLVSRTVILDRPLQLVVALQVILLTFLVAAIALCWLTDQARYARNILTAAVVAHPLFFLWLERELSTPRRVELGEDLVFRWVGRGVQHIPLAELAVKDETVYHLIRNRAYTVDEHVFPGAKDFHRALLARFVVLSRD